MHTFQANGRARAPPATLLIACMYRILHAMPRYHSARESQIYCNIDLFYALLRKETYKFIEAVNYLRNFGLKRPVKTLMSTDILYTITLFYIL